MDIKFEAGSAPGSLQAENGSGIQDSYYFAGSSSGFCAALADGASSAAYAKEGAALAARCVCALLERGFDSLWDLENSRAAEVISGRLKNELRLFAQKRDIPVRELASTLIFAASRGERLIMGHLGDGVIMGLKSGNIIVRSFPENDGRQGTYLTTSQGAGEHLRIYKGSANEQEGLVLMTDGMAGAAFDRGYIPRRKVPLSKLLREGLSLIHGDDASYVLMRWRDNDE